MKIQTLFFAIITFLLLSNTALFPQKSSKIRKAYFKLTIQDNALKSSEFQKPDAADKIKDVLTSEGIQVIPDTNIEKHSESYLYVYVTLKDSMNIYANSSFSGREPVITFQYPDKTYKYNSLADVTKIFRKYIRENIKAKTTKNKN